MSTRQDIEICGHDLDGLRLYDLPAHVVALVIITERDGMIGAQLAVKRDREDLEASISLALTERGGMAPV